MAPPFALGDMLLPALRAPCLNGAVRGKTRPAAGRNAFLTPGGHVWQNGAMLGETKKEFFLTHAALSTARREKAPYAVPQLGCHSEDGQ